jgi:Fe-S-cluster containining protein
MGKKSKSKKTRKLSGVEKIRKKKRTNLRSVLQNVYHDSVSLETNCSHSCECCKVAMPQINYSEFVQIATAIWKDLSHDEILNTICTSLKYFFRYEYTKWGMASLVKPCMFLNSEDRCTIYEDRPLSCRLYGLWPEKDYEERVDKFVKAYEVHGLSREDLPLNTQCKFVKRVNAEKELTTEVIDGLFKQLDDLDQTIGDFSDAQVRQKENYRTFHDWLLLKVFGEEWLAQLTAFILAADKETMEDQIEALEDVVRENFKDSLPNIIKGV